MFRYCVNDKLVKTKIPNNAVVFVVESKPWGLLYRARWPSGNDVYGYDKRLAAKKEHVIQLGADIGRLAGLRKKLMKEIADADEKARFKLGCAVVHDRGDVLQGGAVVDGDGEV